MIATATRIARRHFYHVLDDAILDAIRDLGPIDRFSLCDVPAVRRAAESLLKEKLGDGEHAQRCAVFEVKHRLTALSKLCWVRYDVSMNGWVKE